MEKGDLYHGSRQAARSNEHIAETMKNLKTRLVYSYGGKDDVSNTRAKIPATINAITGFTAVPFD
ncbi:MAG: hypothetical protein IAE90_00435 [Ignavibacteria bacterium]|nr:hypothetical protein [Ignavibacteria bacterium]